MREVVVARWVRACGAGLLNLPALSSAGKSISTRVIDIDPYFVWSRRGVRCAAVADIEPSAEGFPTFRERIG